MKKWKFRRQTFYAMVGEDSFSDLESKTTIPIKVDYTSIVDDAINYFLVQDNVMHYPGKSYAIAIAYASWIEDHFGDDFYETLDDPELLPDDKYFIPYSKDKKNYDDIIKVIDRASQQIDPNKLKYLFMTFNYFKQEFMLDEEGLSILPF